MINYPYTSALCNVQYFKMWPLTICYNPHFFNRFLARAWVIAVAQSDSSRGKQDNLTKHMQHGVRSVNPPGNDVSKNVEMIYLPRFTKRYQEFGGVPGVPTSFNHCDLG